MNKILICLYGMIWLILLSPFVIFIFLGSLCQHPMYPNIVEFVGVISGTYMYFNVVWMPIRKLMGPYDNDFCKVMNW